MDALRVAREQAPVLGRGRSVGIKPMTRVSNSLARGDVGLLTGDALSLQKQRKKATLISVDGCGTLLAVASNDSGCYRGLGVQGESVR
jgi:hypothetical protein